MIPITEFLTRKKSFIFTANTEFNVLHISSVSKGCSPLPSGIRFNLFHGLHIFLVNVMLHNLCSYELKLNRGS